MKKDDEMIDTIDLALSICSEITKINVSSIEQNNNEIEIYYDYNNSPTSDKRLVGSWKSIYNKLYKINSHDQYAGWVNSTTMQPYSYEEMHEWKMDTIQRIQLLQPKTILEIGAGSGILVSELINLSDEYVATDLSNESVDFLKKKFSEEKFSAYCCSADDIYNYLGERKFNVIILNSIIQYFPSYDYFFDVFSNILNYVEDGHIFIGDIKDISVWQKLKMESIEKNDSKLTTSFDDKYNIALSMVNDIELSYDKNLFLLLKEIFPCIVNIDISTKQGKCMTEMNKYRYDCVIKIKNLKQSSASDVNSNKFKWCVKAEKNKLIAIFNVIFDKGLKYKFFNPEYES